MPSLSKHLVSYAELSMQDLWESKAGLQRENNQTKLDTALAPARWVACKRAHLSIDCLMKILHCMSSMRGKLETSDLSRTSTDASFVYLFQSVLQMAKSTLQNLTDKVANIYSCISTYGSTWWDGNMLKVSTYSLLNHTYHVQCRVSILMQ